MTMYKVKRYYDSYNLSDRKLLKNCDLKMLIADELLTVEEVKKYNVPMDCLQKIGVREENIYSAFGATFNE